MGSLGWFLVGAGAGVLLVQRRHLIMVFLCLELMLLGLFVILVAAPYSFDWGLVLLVVGACEAAVGLAILVALSRRYGGQRLGMVGG